MIPLAWAAAFNGALNCAVMLLICPALMLAVFIGRKPVPALLRYGAAAGCICAGWSYYVSRFDLENSGGTVLLAERYARLPKGLNMIITETPVPGILMGVLLMNMAFPRMLLPLSALRTALT